MTGSDLTTALAQFLAYRPHQALFLLVHPQVSRLTAAAHHLHQQYPTWPHLALSTSLAQSLRDIAPTQRPRQTPRLLASAIRQYNSGPLLCTDIDLLFEPALQLDPLRLFLDASRQTALIVAWPGTYHNNNLAYAVPEHAHYRTWSRPQLDANYVVQLSDP